MLENLFINTGPVAELYANPMPPDPLREIMTWDEIGQLIGKRLAYRGTYGDASETCLNFSLADASGETLRAELEQCDKTLKKHLGITPQDFAFTGTSWSSIAEREVSKRYRFGQALDCGDRISG